MAAALRVFPRSLLFQPAPAVRLKGSEGHRLPSCASTSRCRRALAIHGHIFSSTPLPRQLSIQEEPQDRLSSSWPTRLAPACSPPGFSVTRLAKDLSKELSKVQGPALHSRVGGFGIRTLVLSLRLQKRALSEPNSKLGVTQVAHHGADLPDRPALASFSQLQLASPLCSSRPAFCCCQTSKLCEASKQLFLTLYIFIYIFLNEST